MYLAAFLLPGIASALLMPLIRGAARRRGLFDEVGERKIHKGKIPRLGGIGIFCAAMLFDLGLIFFPLPGLTRGYLLDQVEGWGPVVLGAFVVQGLGLVDDLRGLRPRCKFLFESVVAAALVFSGLRFDGLGAAPDALSGSLGWLSAALTWLWIVGLSNAINLIDGMDGLAGIIVLIAGLDFGVFYYLAGDSYASLACLALAGATLGFLTVNLPLPKASMFMGDSGSLFLGYSVAIMPLIGRPTAQAASGRVGLIPAAILLAVPIFDTVFAMFRRIRAGVPISTGDKKHLHHRLLGRGLSSRRILLIVASSMLIQSLAFFLILLRKAS